MLLKYIKHGLFKCDLLQKLKMTSHIFHHNPTLWQLKLKNWNRVCQGRDKIISSIIDTNPPMFSIYYSVYCRRLESSEIYRNIGTK